MRTHRQRPHPPRSRGHPSDAGPLTYAELDDRARRAAHALHRAGVPRNGTVAVMLPERRTVLRGGARRRATARRRGAGQHPLQGRRGRLDRARLGRAGGRHHGRAPPGARAGRRRPPARSSRTDGREAERRGRRPRRRLADVDGLHVGHDRTTEGRRDRRRTTSAATPRASPHRACAGTSVPTTCTSSSVRSTTRVRRSGARCTSRSAAALVIMERWDAERALAAHRAAPGDEHAHGPGQLPAHPGAPRSDAGPLRPLVAEARRARGRAVPGAAQARVHGVRRPRQGVGVLRRVGGRRHRDLARGVARASRAASASRSPGNEFAILDDDGNELPAGEVGTVYAKPAGSSFEYHNDPDKTAKAHHDGFFTVGDAGYLDDDGYLYLTDRKSDMVISGGVNIYPREIEECLFRNPDVVDCAVLGVPDPEWGEVLYAIVQPRAGVRPRRGRGRRLGARSPRRLQAARASSSSSTSCRGIRTARCASRSSARRTWRAIRCRADGAAHGRTLERDLPARRVDRGPIRSGGTGHLPRVRPRVAGAGAGTRRGRGSARTGAGRRRARRDRPPRADDAVRRRPHPRPGAAPRSVDRGDAGSRSRRALYTNVLDVLAAIHRIDPPSALEPRDDLAFWADYLDWSEAVPDRLRRAFDWCSAQRTRGRPRRRSCSGATCASATSSSTTTPRSSRCSTGRWHRSGRPSTIVAWFFALGVAPGRSLRRAGAGLPGAGRGPGALRGPARPRRCTRSTGTRRSRWSAARRSWPGSSTSRASRSPPIRCSTSSRPGLLLNNDCW